MARARYGPFHKLRFFFKGLTMKLNGTTIPSRATHCAWCKIDLDPDKPPACVNYANKVGVEYVCDKCFEAARKQNVRGTY